MISMLVGLLQTAVLFIGPALLVGLAVESVALGITVFVAAYALYLSFSVRSIRLGVDGIHFQRVFGSPRFLAWESISSIEEASRAELILRGWLWPLFPAREMTACFSSLGHYRITWKTGYCYFPPADSQLFEALVLEMKK